LPWLYARHCPRLLLFGQKAEGHGRFCSTPEFPDTGKPAGVRWLFAVAKLGRKRRNFAAGFATDAPMLIGYVRVSTDDSLPM